MRPTDENQSPSLRPNLMSPRRSSGEDSILAMLERDPARKRDQGSGARLAWYGASAAMAVVLTGVLVWLAAANDGRQADGVALALDHAILASSGSSPGSTGRHAPSIDAPKPFAVVRQVAMATNAASIVDQDPGNNVVPLRLLKPAPSTIRLPVPVPVAVPARPARRATAATTEARPVERPRALAAARNSARPGQGKAQRTPAPGKATDTHVDADVALISAVIVHANGHAPTGSQMTELICPNDGCKEKPARH
ncbi:hypothetical protein [Massilia sp. H6]|uniref:hypothetical protein n=1 Tax=Massilia sp. H6 TaxID=2970464 RepID=UPI0021677A5F|nr:hypothetical protein [Massilia sp. H6]UVW30322.1 hypothetical protein NRS07_09440 [Massilia sp. H6]